MLFTYTFKFVFFIKEVATLYFKDQSTSESSCPKPSAATLGVTHAPKPWFHIGQVKD